MCSSPKSSRTIRKSLLKGVFDDMDPSTRASFVAKANAAQERRSELKKVAAKRQQMGMPDGLSKKPVSKKNKPINENLLLRFLHRMGCAV